VSCCLGVRAGVGGKIDGRLKPSPGGSEIDGGFLGCRRRKKVHSVQVHDIFKREKGVASILICGIWVEW
jgi:hypothetical protein